MKKTLTLILILLLLSPVLRAQTGENAAWQATKQANTIEAYQAFMEAYPDTYRAELIGRQIAYLAWQDAKQANTEKAYRQFVMTYPRSDYYTRALEAWARLEVKQIRVRNWDNLFAYADICMSQGYPEKAQLVAPAMGKIAEREHDIWKLTVCLQLPHEETQRRCALALRELALQQETIDMLDKLYYDGLINKQLLPDSLIRHDKIATSAYRAWHEERMGAVEAIRDLAPCRTAYEILLIYLRDDLQAHRRKAALEKMDSVADAMSSSRDYQELRRVLEAPREDLSLTRLPNTVNSEKGTDTYVAVVSADQQTMYVCKRTTESYLHYDEDIYISRRDASGEWTQALPVGELNTPGNDAPLAISADGQQLLIFRDGKMMQTRKTHLGWSEPTPLSDSVNIGTWNADAMITSDGRAMLFSAVKQVPYEADVSINIFVSLKNSDGEWGEPIDLGPTINTDGIDRTPFLHPDMKTLYFSSDRHGNMGGMDVFVCHRLSEDCWTEWSEPKNLGRNVNDTEKNWYYRISTDGETAYFSGREQKQEGIYTIRVPEALRPQPVATVSGHLTDKHGRAVSTEMRWEDLEAQRIVGESHSDPTDGAYFIVLPEGKLYGFYIEDPSLYPTAHNVDLRHADRTVKVEEDVQVITIKEMIDDGIPAPLNNLFFDSDEYRLLAPSRAELKRVAEIIRSLGVRVEISGHTDATGTRKHNQQLSQQRADAVRHYLIQLGVNARSITARGYADTRPADTNATAAGRKANRRVEIRFLK